MHLPEFSPNLLIIIAIAGGALYGAIGGKNRLKLLILSTYVGIVLATQLAGVVVKATHQATDLVTLSLFALPILLFGFGSHGKSSKHESNGSIIANLVIGLATGALIAASALKLLPPSEAAAAAGGSLVGTELMMYQFWLLALLPLVAFMFGLMKNKDKH